MLKSTFNVQAYIPKKLNGNIDELTQAMKMQSEWISINKMHAANKTISKVISLWLEETLLHSAARKRNNDNLQPTLSNYFTYQTPDSAGKFAETKQNKGLACDEIYGYSNLRSSANNGPHISWTLSTVKLENITCNLSHHLRKPQVRKSN